MIPSDYANKCEAIKIALVYTQAYLLSPNPSKLQSLLKDTIQVQITIKETKALKDSRTISRGQIRFFNDKNLFGEWLTYQHFNNIQKIKLKALKIIGKDTQAKIEMITKEMFLLNNHWIEREQMETTHLITDHFDDKKRIIKITTERVFSKNSERILSNFPYICLIPSTQHCFDFLEHYLVQPEQRKLLRIVKKHSFNKNFDITTWVNAHLPKLRETSFIRLKIDLENGEEKICSVQKVEYQPGKTMKIRVINTLKLSPLTFSFKAHSFKCADEVC